MCSNIFLFLLGYFGVGNDIFSSLIGWEIFGRFDDFKNLSAFANRIPNKDIHIQYTSFLIYLGRILPSNFILILTIIFGLTLPIFLIYRKVNAFRTNYGLWYVLLITMSYPFIFAFFRGNFILPAVLWAILSLLTFFLNKGSEDQIQNDNYLPAFALVFASLLHPATSILSLVFVSDNFKKFLKIILSILLLNLFFYSLLDKSLSSTLLNQIESLKLYKTTYVFGGAGDLYNNSLFLLFKIIFFGNDTFLTFFLSLIPFFMGVTIFLRMISINRHYGSQNTTFLFGIYFLPVAIIILSPVSADYKLLFLYLPIIFMFIKKYYEIPFFLFLFSIMPKHFIFFSSYWLSGHPDAIMVYPDLIKTLGITLNSIINPIILFISIFIPKHILIKFVR